MILVVGASGLLGRRVAAALLAGGHPVRVAGRSTRKLEPLIRAGAEPVRLDLTRPADLAPALAGVEAVFTAVHGLLGRRRDSTAQVDIEGLSRLAVAARQTGARRFVHTSVHGADPNSPVDFLRTKAEAERRLASAFPDLVILRPTAFADLHAHEMIGSRVAAGKPVWLLGSGDTRRNLVAVDDVAAVALRALTEPDFPERLVEISGPDTLGDREIAALYGRITGRRVRLRRAPGSIIRGLAAAAAPLHAGPRALLTFLHQLDEQGGGDFDASRMTALLGRAPISLETLARTRLGR